MKCIRRGVRALSKPTPPYFDAVFLVRQARAKGIKLEPATLAALARYASVTGRMEDAKVRLRHAIHLDKNVCESTMKI
jgi:hypothetical protein